MEGAFLRLLEVSTIPECAPLLPVRGTKEKKTKKILLDHSILTKERFAVKHAVIVREQRGNRLQSAVFLHQSSALKGVR